MAASALPSSVPNEKHMKNVLDLLLKPRLGDQEKKESPWRDSPPAWAK